MEFLFFVIVLFFIGFMAFVSETEKNFIKLKRRIRKLEKKTDTLGLNVVLLLDEGVDVNERTQKNQQFRRKK